MNQSLEIFSEGKVKFFAQNLQFRKAKVFFNPMRSLDRDLNVLLIDTLSKNGLIGLDLFGASGVRGLRLVKETDKFDKMFINDIKTVDFIDKNIKLNHLSGKVKSSNFNAFNISKFYDIKFDYIDVDPFGSPIPYLSEVFKLVKNNSIIAETATDTAVLYGKSKEKCERMYGAFSFKTTYFNEVGLRILIKRTAEIAESFGFSVRPIFFDVRKHYIRVYLATKKARSSEDNIGFIYQCSNCLNRTITEHDKCDFCGGKIIKIGPLWINKLFDRKLVNKMYNLSLRIMVDKSSYLDLFRNEKDIITYYTTDSLASFLKINEKSIYKFKDRTVLNPKGFRTNLSFKELIEYYKSV